VATNTSFLTAMDAYNYTGTAGQMLSLAFYWGSAPGFTPGGLTFMARTDS